ncbi:DUF2249 domain-containing protein (plasmid) [Haloferax sp. S1W]|uniref:DUF2249 domain-containing protein n=1 Tax=Haloferax sp. S1W TaxID=3377110 RepID=UPI0037CAAF0F
MTRLDVRDLEPAQRHPKILDTFEDLASGESLVLVNDHDPRPLYYQFVAEVDEFDAGGYDLEQVAEDEFVAVLPKQ